MYDVIIKRGDTRNCIKAVLKDASGTPVDLTDCSVSFHMAPLNRPAVISRAAHIENAATGEIWLVWAPGETDIAGIFRAEFEVVYQDGRRETFPNNGYISLLIQNDLG
jgi:hypothetical protein